MKTREEAEVNDRLNQINKFVTATRDKLVKEFNKYIQHCGFTFITEIEYFNAIQAVMIGFSVEVMGEAYIKFKEEVPSFTITEQGISNNFPSGWIRVFKNYIEETNLIRTQMQKTKH